MSAQERADIHSPGELLCKSIPVLDHTFGIDGSCVLGWSPDRRLVARRKVGLNFALADRSIVQKLFRINLPLIDPGPPLRQRRTAHCSKAQDHSK